MKSDEHLVGTAAGVQTARTIRRREASLQFESKLLEELAGAPWDTKFGVGRPRGSTKAKILAALPQAELTEKAATNNPKPETDAEKETETEKAEGNDDMEDKPETRDAKDSLQEVRDKIW